MKEKANGRVPVIASGHISDSLEDQAHELNEIAKTGVDTVILLTNRFAKLNEIRGTQLKLFNANTSTLLESLELGAHGFSGVMANFQSDLYVWLTENFDKEPEKARKLNDFLTVSSLIERQVYPVNAKYYLKSIGVLNSVQTRTRIQII